MRRVLKCIIELYQSLHFRGQILACVSDFAKTYSNSFGPTTGHISLTTILIHGAPSRAGIMEWWSADAAPPNPTGNGSGLHSPARSFPIARDKVVSAYRAPGTARTIASLQLSLRVSTAVLRQASRRPSPIWTFAHCWLTCALQVESTSRSLARESRHASETSLT